MLSINPIKRALTPCSSAAAQKVIAPNYDEFQSDLEIWQILQAQPESILRVTMAHCAVPSEAEIVEDGSESALARAVTNLEQYRAGHLARVVENALFIYEIQDVRRPDQRQIGLLGSALTGQIRTADNPGGSIVRNEGIREAKARGRAELIDATSCFTEIVNNAVEDPNGEFAGLLEQIADSTAPAFVVFDERRNRHSMWSITDQPTQRKLQTALNDRAVAYVADGNHRSAAAAMLGKPEFLAVFFTTERMGIFPYNRLVEAPALKAAELSERLAPHFQCRVSTDPAERAPKLVHTVAIYTDRRWIIADARPELYFGKPAAEQIDAALVQDRIIAGVLGIQDAKDERITYVGGNKEVEYLSGRVDSGEFQYALSLAAVQMQQFVAVCRENSFMPPKSTWFEPKVRSGLVMSLLSKS